MRDRLAVQGECPFGARAPGRHGPVAAVRRSGQWAVSAPGVQHGADCLFGAALTAEWIGRTGVQIEPSGALGVDGDGDGTLTTGV